MRALTLKRPWPAAYLLPHDPKRFDNRGYLPPASAMGEVLALHAGLGMWPGTINKVPIVGAPLANGVELIHWRMNADITGVFATVRLVGWVRQFPGAVIDYHFERNTAAGLGQLSRERVDAVRSSRWWIGPVAWVFEDFRSLTGHHIACSGGQRVWNLPADVAAQVEAITK